MAKETIHIEEATRRVLQEHGNLPAPELAAMVGRQYGLKLDPRFVPFIKASLRDRARAEARRAAVQASGDATPGIGPAGSDPSGGVAPTISPPYIGVESLEPRRQGAPAA